MKTSEHFRNVLRRERSHLFRQPLAIVSTLLAISAPFVNAQTDQSGIPAQIQDRIFDPFFTTKPMGHGTGLGLDIVRRLVRHNDGEIAVESRPGRTEFRVVLPVAGSDGSGVPR